jgi:hypothetical protein
MYKGGGAKVAPTKCGKGMKIMAIVDRHGLRFRMRRTISEVRLIQLWRAARARPKSPRELHMS